MPSILPLGCDLHFIFMFLISCRSSFPHKEGWEVKIVLLKVCCYLKGHSNDAYLVKPFISLASTYYFYKITISLTPNPYPSGSWK